MLLTADQLLKALCHRGVTVHLRDGKIHVLGKNGLLRPEELQRLRELKSEIIEILEGAEEQPILRRPEDSIVPLTNGLKGIGTHLTTSGPLLTTRARTYGFRVFGPLHIHILQESIEAVVHRQEALRTRFVLRNGHPIQQIDPPSERKLAIVDLEHGDNLSANERIDRAVEEFKGEKVDVSIGLLFDARLLRLSSQHHALIFAIDHMISDGLSDAITISEILALYRSRVNGVPSSLSPAPVQFGDYAVWQSQTDSSWHKQHAAYWKTRLIGAPHLRLPYEEGLEPIESPVAMYVRTCFGKTLTSSIREHAKRQETLPSLILLSAYIVVLSRWCNQFDFVLRTVTHGRYRPELADVVGFIATHVFLRVRLDPDDCLRDLQHRIEHEFFTSCNHHDFDRVPHLIPGIFTSLGFNWIREESALGSVHRITQEDGDVRFEPMTFQMTEYPWFELVLRVLDSHTEAGITTIVAYRSNLFSRQTMEILSDNLRLVTRELLAEP